ncbi:MAG TPA: nucleotidyltransferase family protein [Solirubrobacteraceae bacterium]|nr:nucleotidyltransferase family protein [Solirubrobacteraceae bacterium]
MDRVGAQRQLILLAAGTQARRRTMRERASLLANEIDWTQLAEVLSIRRLLPTLGPRIVELAGEHASDDFRTAVDRSLEAGRRQGVLLQLVSRRVSAELARAGIRSTPLKGPSLGDAIYGDPGRRPSSDIDLLVARERLRDAVEVVRELGYGAPTDHVDRDGLPQLHFALVHERGELPPVELHWRVHWYEQSFAGERLLGGSDVREDWRPAPADELAALLLFYARDGFLDVRLATDVGAWWDAFGKRLAPGSLRAVLDAYPALVRVLTASARVAEKIVGLPAGELIGWERKLDRRGRIAVRLANPNPHGTSQAQLYADMGLIDGLLAPRGGMGAFARRQLLPPREVLRERAQHAQQGRPSSSMGHGMRVLGRYGLALARLARAPETLRAA